MSTIREKRRKVLVLGRVRVLSDNEQDKWENLSTSPVLSVSN